MTSNLLGRHGRGDGPARDVALESCGGAADFIKRHARINILHYSNVAGFTPFLNNRGESKRSFGPDHWVTHAPWSFSS
jgi:hypothetical protein